jgi:muramoyltetrapeptide carboxypeptidase
MRTPPIIKPERLNFGDTVAIVAPASPPPDPANIDRGMAGLEGLGFKVKLPPHLRRRWGFLAGTDRERAGDLMRMFADPEVKAIFCLRGGYGAGRLLSRLDYGMIRRNPKIFVGYSDITALHCALLIHAGLVSFHGPMANSDLAKPKVPEFTLQGLLRTLMNASAPGSICQGLKDNGVTVIRRGKASGRLLGGNLSLLCTTMGTPYQPVFKGRILVLEDVDEVPFRFDRMLTHLMNAGVLQEVAGVAVGINANCVERKKPEDGKPKKPEYRQTVEDVLKERLRPLEVPIVIGLPFGHIPEIATLPLGVEATLDANKGDLVVTEAAVR